MLAGLVASLAFSFPTRAWYDARPSPIAAKPQEIVMGLMERLQEIAKVLPENDLAEVIGFAEALKAMARAISHIGDLFEVGPARAYFHPD